MRVILQWFSIPGMQYSPCATELEKCDHRAGMRTLPHGPTSPPLSAYHVLYSHHDVLKVPPEVQTRKCSFKRTQSVPCYHSALSRATF